MVLGKKLKILRGNMTQAELAKRSGVDKAIISKIESGKMEGTVKCHGKLAAALGLKLSEFYAFFETGKVEPVEFHQADSKTDFYQDFLEILTAHPLSKKMLPTFITLQPNEEKFLEETLKKVERFIVIIRGQIEIEVEGKVYSLKKEYNRNRGDCLYSISAKRHKIKNTGLSVANALCISAPPIL
jgi:transcriptional regulator with XRE-family HTH domain